MTIFTSVILNDTSYEPHHGSELVMNNIYKLLNQNGIKVIDSNPTHLNWMKNKKFLHNLSKCNVVIVNGEGTIHHDQPRAKNLVKVAKYVKNLSNKPVVLLNSTYQENGSEITENMKYFDSIYVRETLSLKELQKNNITSKVVPDITFYSKYDLSLKKFDHRTGVTDSVNDSKSNKLFSLSAKKNFIFLPILTNIKWKSYFRKYEKIKNIYRYFRYIFIRYYAFLFSRVRKSKLDYKSKQTLYHVQEYNEYIQKIANLNFLITGRYHSLCFSIKTLTPFFAIKSNSFKIEGILEDIDINSKRIIEERNIENIRIQKFSEDELAKINQFINNAPIRIEEMFKEIRRLIELEI